MQRKFMITGQLKHFETVETVETVENSIQKMFKVTLGSVLEHSNSSTKRCKKDVAILVPSGLFEHCLFKLYDIDAKYQHVQYSTCGRKQYRTMLVAC